MLKSRLLVSAAFLIALAPLPSLGGSPQDKPTPKATLDSHSRARKVYTQDCALCHGENGSGQTDVGKSMGLSSDWTKQSTLAGKSDDALFEIIRKGKGSNMPPEVQGRADDATVKHLIEYIRGFSKAAAAAPTEAAK